MNNGTSVRIGGTCELCGKSTSMECFRNPKGNEFCFKCYKILHGAAPGKNEADVSDLY